MADSDSTTVIDLTPFKREGLSEFEERIVQFFEPGFAALPTSGADEAAKIVFDNLRTLVSADADEQAALRLDTWEALVGIARLVPHRHQGQDMLVKTLQLLSTAAPWTNLDGLSRCLEDKGWKCKCIPPPTVGIESSILLPR